ncbi:unnamed protein product [Ilex paraguariensis]|uniref:Uncharacterized protein n=1 Tax=Ilex paraguariensis TaxID=185542 RepID=A0ABC8R619_9AQUA
MAFSSTSSSTGRTSCTPSPPPKSYNPSSHLPIKFNKFTSCPSTTTAKTFPIVCTLARESTSRQPMVEEKKESEPVILLRPDSFGRFGKFGGKYVPETLMYALTELESAFKSLAGDQDFQNEGNEIEFLTKWDEIFYGRLLLL